MIKFLRTYPKTILTMLSFFGLIALAILWFKIFYWLVIAAVCLITFALVVAAVLDTTGEGRK